MSIKNIGNLPAGTGYVGHKGKIQKKTSASQSDTFTPSKRNSEQVQKDFEAAVHVYSQRTRDFVEKGMEELKHNANKMGVLAGIGTAAAVVGLGAALLPTLPLMIGAGAIGIAAGIGVRNMAYPR